jgi:hypothetical protein
VLEGNIVDLVHGVPFKWDYLDLPSSC